MAPPVWLALLSDFEPPSAGLLFSSAEAPPALPAPELLEPPLLASSPPSPLLASLPEDPEDSSLPDVDLLDVVDVEVVGALAFSALVSVGGVISGVLLGI